MIDLDTLAEDLVPVMADLCIAVADRCPDDVARILTPLDTQHLYALAVVLASHIDPERPLTPMHSRIVDRAIALAAADYGITAADIRADIRTAVVVRARHVAMLAAHMTGVAYAEIGRDMRRDHTTVMSGCRRARGSDTLKAHARHIADQLINFKDVRAA